MGDAGGGDLFAIEEREVDGRPLRVFTNAPPSLRTIWQLSAGHGDATYLVYEGERTSYAEAHTQVAALAHHLAGSLRVTKGDRVAIAMRNYPEWVVAFWAAAAVGAVVVPLNAWWTGPELAYGLTDSGAKVLVADGERLERLGPHLAGTGVEAVIAARTDAPVPPGTRAWADVLDEALDRSGGDATLPPAEVGPDDDATIMYTSGTTGRPKGAVGTNRNVGAHIMNVIYATTAPPADAVEPAGSGGSAPAGGASGLVGERPVTLLTFPLFHVGGLHSFLLPYTVAGGTVVLLYRWDTATALDLVEREGVTAIGGVPTTMFELLDEARRQGRDLPTLTGVASGATLVPPELVRRIDGQLGSRAAPTNGYGLTETAGAAIANVGRRYLDRPNSVGQPISPVMEVRIADPDGRPVPAGETGEVWLRGPTVFRGYHGNSGATAAALTDDGWFRTGDAGMLDDDGYLYVVDRLKDVIIRGGENVYAAEVEAVLYEHPDVAEAAIVGVPDERLGEQVAAVVRLRPGAVTGAEAVRAHVAARLAAFKVPSVVHLTPDALPRNAAGKVLKRELRTQLAGEPVA
ncbi:MAG TPA: AMP-binding protein [Acidimicrobiales bacterium]|nr:AMP-binding protein [Acidimicrobiales bacterium]